MDSYESVWRAKYSLITAHLVELAIGISTKSASDSRTVLPRGLRQSCQRCSTSARQGHQQVRVVHQPIRNRLIHPPPGSPVPQAKRAVPGGRRQYPLDIEPEAAEHWPDVQPLDLRQTVNCPVPKITLSDTHHSIMGQNSPAPLSAPVATRI